jgi:hypothetical protein
MMMITKAPHPHEINNNQSGARRSRHVPSWNIGRGRDVMPLKRQEQQRRGGRRGKWTRKQRGGRGTWDAPNSHDHGKNDRKPSGRGKDNNDVPTAAADVLPFLNNGSFLKHMKRELSGGGGFGGGVALWKMIPPSKKMEDRGDFVWNIPASLSLPFRRLFALFRYI